MKDTILAFNEQSEAQINQLSASTSNVKDATKYHHFSKKPQKSSAAIEELERLKSFNKITNVSFSTTTTTKVFLLNKNFKFKKIMFFSFYIKLIIS